MPNAKPLAFHGVQNPKYAMRTSDGAPGSSVISLPRAKSIALNPVFSKQDVYASNQLILSVPNDQGYDSTLGVTGQDIDFEVAIGHAMLLNSGYASIEVKDLRRFDMYYEYVLHPDGGYAYVVKVWLLNIAVTGKPAWQHDTDTESLTIAPYQYSMKHYGDVIKAATGDDIFIDANGFSYKAFIMRSIPTDTGYATFETAVPVPKVPAAG